jgi:hypothetical protein
MLRTRLHKLAGKTKERARSIPPPASFRTRTGLVMRLIGGAGKSAFYVSETPVPEALFRRFLAAAGRPEEASPETAPKTAADSDAPADPATGMDWYTAERFCRWLSEQEGHPYRLPEIVELRAFSAAGHRPSIAVWSKSRWRHQDFRKRAVAKRFAIEMFGVWDPTGTLAEKRLFAELPLAAYPRLGFFVVTGPDTGRSVRWDRLKQQLDDQDL